MTTETVPSGTTSRSDPAYQAFRILQIGFVAAPVIAGLDKFFHLLADWDSYLAPAVVQAAPLSPAGILAVVGVVEIAAGVVVALRPRIGGYLVSAWLLGIIVNLLLVPGFFDIALRDLGLALGALALARLSTTYAA